MKRLAEYMNTTADYKLHGFLCDHPDDLEIWLFADADLSSDPDTSRSTKKRKNERKKKIFDFIDRLLQETGKIGEYDQKI